MEGIQKVCQLVERYDGYGGMEGGVGRCDNVQ